MEINAVNLYIFTQGSSVDPPPREEAAPQEEQVLQEIKEKKKLQTSETPKIETSRAFIDVDENDNVVIKVVDSDGKIVKQFPSEERLKAAEFLEGHLINLFEAEA